MDINLSHGDAPKLRGLSKSMTAEGWRHEPSLLFYADGTDPDLRYFGGFHAMDPYLAFAVGQTKVAVASIHELDKMLSESDFDEILPLPELQQEAIRRFKLKQGTRPHESDLIRLIAERFRIRSFRVGNRFPAGLLVALQQAGIAVEVDRQPALFAQRQIKRAWEVEAIRKGNRA
ncbi:MAG TPA: hypothetical protein VFY13_02885, partial [Luteolibacter sp.]|nr:hypothetical protein [Luteolibacter sp.]